MNEAKPYRFIISGGGTGGHIYPAIAVANEIKAQYQDAEILFVGAQGKMEMTKVPEAGFEIVGLWISGLQRKLDLRNLLLPFKIISSISKAKKIIRQFQPDAVIGFGGYASAPMLNSASKLGISTVLQEQNSYAGLTNKLLGGRAKKICVAYEGMEKYFPAEKIVLTGNPVRKDIMNLDRKRPDAREFYGLAPERKTLLVLGGSLGARTINESIIQNIKQLVDSRVQVIWQTGRLYFKEMQSRMEEVKQKDLRVVQFIDNMDLAYAVADVVISRAGALSISELCLAKKPVIFVPSPNVAEDHQTKNAKYLVDKQAAEMVPDKEAIGRLVTEALDLLEDTERQATLKENIALQAKPDAAKDIVNEIMQVVE